MQNKLPENNCVFQNGTYDEKKCTDWTKYVYIAYLVNVKYAENSAICIKVLKRDIYYHIILDIRKQTEVWKMEQRIRRNMICVLKGELVKALGCTEPIAIAYVSAKAREILGKMPEKLWLDAAEIL